MKSEKKGDMLAVHLSQDEVFRLQAGNVVGDRLGLTLPDAKINVWPLSAIKPDDSLRDKWTMDGLEKGLAVPLEARMDTDGNLSVFVPAIKLTDVRISGAHIARESIETPGLKDKGREGLLHHAIPEKGVIVAFGGSLKEVDVNTFSTKKNN